MSKVRINADLPAVIAKHLTDLATQRGTTMSDVLRQAIATEAFLQECQDRGDKVLVARTGEPTRELVFVR